MFCLKNIMASKRFAVFSVIVCFAVLLTGCANPSLRGSPFYTDVKSIPDRPQTAEEPLNLWPLVHYNNNAVHILGPFIEKTDNHFAVRPLMSVYGMAEGRPVYNVLWPIARFDPKRNRHRIFPFYWGDDFRAMFPLYWHKGSPLGDKGGYDTLIPLWYFGRNSKGYNTHILWPVFNVKDNTQVKGWRAWPLFGRYSDKKDSDVYSFYAWPLGHFWKSNSNSGVGHTLLPLYLRWRSDSERAFFSLPYSHLYRKNGDGWHCVFPLYLTGLSDGRRSFDTLLGGYSKDQSVFSWWFLPLLSSGKSDGDAGMLSVLGPVAGGRWNKDESQHHFFPLYYASKDQASRTFITLPYAHHRKKSSGWDYLLPLYIKSYGADRSSFTSIPYISRQDGKVRKWFAPPLLSGGSVSSGEGSFWIAGPLAHRRWGAEQNGSHLFPLWYRSASDEGSLFLSAPWMAWRGSDASSWSSVPMLYWQSSNERGTALLTPVFARGEEKELNRKWHAVVPLYYKSTSDAERMLVTLAGGYRKNADGRRWLVYPLASWGSYEEGQGSVWLGGPLFHANWNEKGSLHHLLPLYYWNGREDTFASAVFSRWSHGRGRTMLVPPLLSWFTYSDKRKDLWLAGPAARFSWGADRGPWHVLPLYYSNPKTGTKVSPLFAKWENEDKTKTVMVPPALSWVNSSPEKTDLWVGGALARFSWGRDAEREHIFPLYYRNRKTGTFVSLPLARWKSGQQTSVIVPPLLGGYFNSGSDKQAVAALGLFSNTWGHKYNPPSGHLIPLYMYRGRKEVYTPITGWDMSSSSGFVYPLTPLLGIRTGDSAGSWLFPLYSYKRDRKGGAVNTRFLPWGVYERNKHRVQSSLFPLYEYANVLPPEDIDSVNRRATYGKRFWSLPAVWYRNETLVRSVRDVPGSGKTNYRKTLESSNGFFPLWSYSSTEVPDIGSEKVESSILAFLYQHGRETRTDVETKEALKENSSSSILWYLWRKDKVDDEVSVSMFPTITYERRGDEFKRITFLYRFFRYERGPEGKKLNLLFIPVIR